MGDTFPLSGSIDPRSFPFLLTNLHRNGATGSLKVEGPSYQKAIYFRGGRILFGSSNDPRDQLGAILIEHGKITPEQLEDVNTKVGPGSPLAKVLAETGFVSQRELSEAARAKVERILSDVMAYTSGTFEFEDGVLPKGAVDLKLASDALVVSAVRALADRNFVLRHLEGLGAVLAPPRGAPPTAADLPPEAQALLEQLDGRTTLKDAAAKSRLEEFEVAKVACALLFLGLVERRELTGISPREPEPAFHLDDGSELDLAETARAALAVEPTADVDPFFVSAAPEPPAGFDSIELPPPPPRPPTPLPPVPPQPVLALEGPELAIAPPPPRALPLVPPPPRHPVEPEKPAPQAPASPAAATPASPVPAFPSPFDRPGPATPSAKRPSKDELAALDALLDSRPAEGPLAPLSKRPEPEWAPRFGQTAGRTGRPTSSRGRGLLIVISLAALLGLGGGSAWYFLLHPATLPSPQPSAATPLPPTPTTVAALPSAQPSLPVSISGAPPSAAPPTTTPPTPTPAPPTTQAPQVKPSAPATGVPGLSEARSLLQSGNYDQAGRAFVAHLKAAPAGSATIQVLVACSPETLQKASAAVGAPDLFIVAVNFKGRDCFRLCWGIYPDQGAAQNALRTLPAYFRENGANPRAVTTREILP